MVQPLPLPSGSSLLTSRDEAKLPILEAIYPYFFLILISEAVKDCFLFPQIWVPGSLEGSGAQGRPACPILYPDPNEKKKGGCIKGPQRLLHPQRAVPLRRPRGQLLSLLLIFLFAGCINLSASLPKLIEFQTVNDTESFGLS